MHSHRFRFGPAALAVFMLFAAFAPTAAAEDTLSDVLLEKGIITKEDWLRIRKAAETRDETADPRTVEDTRAAEDLMMSIVERRDAEAERRTRDKAPPVTVGWGNKGFSLATGDGLFKTTLQWRFQGRWTYPERSDPRDAGDFADHEESSFELRRVRMKIGGHGYRPWLQYYVEIDLQPGRDFDDSSAAAHTRLLDWRITLERYPWAMLRLGQWKINYSRERVDSSGKQTFVERSIMNRVFTIDRQIGAMLYGRLNPGTPADVNYYAGVFSGGGRGLANNDDAHMMYMGRLQWNVFGRELKWRQSDTTFHARPAASVSIGGYTTIGTCTRWSSGGCGHLDGYADPSNDDVQPGRFRVEGVQVGSAFKYRGFAWQHETHWKQIKDAGNAAEREAWLTAGNETRPDGLARQTHLFGGYVQAGYFPHYLIPAVPKPLEAAFRYAHVDPNLGTPSDRRREFTAGLNWFFAGHRNKLTLDASHLTLEQSQGTDLTEQRVRLQWDVSF